MRKGIVHPGVFVAVALSGLLTLQCSCDDDEPRGGESEQAGAAGVSSAPQAGAAGRASAAGAAGQASVGGAAGQTSVRGAAGQPSEGGAAGGPQSAAGAGGRSQGGAGGAGGVGAAGEGGAAGAPPECPLLSTIVPDPDITRDTVIPEGCFIVTEELFVSDQATLTLSPGVTLKFEEGVGLRAMTDGALSAVGTEAKPILLTGTQSERGHWGGVQFVNSASESNALDYVTIEYAGSEEIQDAGARPLRANLYLNSSGFDVRASIQHTTLRHSSGYGLYVAGEAIMPDFSDNELTDNESGAAYAYASVVHQLAESSSYAGNDKDVVFVNAAYEFGQDARTWQTLDVPYRMDGVFIIDTQLTLSAGTTLEFTDDSGIEIATAYAGITAIGTEELPIVFTGVTKEAGSWNGLYFANTDDEDSSDPRSRLEYVVVEYGGAYDFLDSNAATVRGNVMLDSSGWVPAITLEHSTISNSSGYGIWLECTAVLNASDNELADNNWADQAKEANCAI